MFEARVGEKEFSPPLRRRVLLRLQRAGHGRRRHKFKGISRFDRGERAFLPLLVKIRSRFCSRQNFGVSEERFSAISASASLQANFWWRLLNFQLPAPFLQQCEAQVGSFAAWVMGMQKHWGRIRSWSSSQPLLCATSSALSYSLVSFLSIM